MTSLAVHFGVLARINKFLQDAPIFTHIHSINCMRMTEVRFVKLFLNFDR